MWVVSCDFSQFSLLGKLAVAFSLLLVLGSQLQFVRRGIGKLGCRLAWQPGP